MKAITRAVEAPSELVIYHMQPGGVKSMDALRKSMEKGITKEYELAKKMLEAVQDPMERKSIQRFIDVAEYHFNKLVETNAYINLVRPSAEDIRGSDFFFLNYGISKSGVASPYGITEWKYLRPLSKKEAAKYDEIIGMTLTKSMFDQPELSREEHLKTVLNAINSEFKGILRVSFKSRRNY